MIRGRGRVRPHTLVGLAAALTGFLGAGFLGAGLGAALGAGAALALGGSGATLAFFALGADAGSGAPRFGRVSESGTSAAFLAGLAGDLVAALVGFAAGFAAAFAGAAAGFAAAFAGALACDLLYASINCGEAVQSC